MRLTIGQTVKPAARPSPRQTAAAHSKMATFAQSGRELRSNSPDISPSIMVASEGTKFSVAYPPSLNLNGVVRGNRFRNQVSNFQPTLLFLLKCAAMPVKCSVQSDGTPTAA